MDLYFMHFIQPIIIIGSVFCDNGAIPYTIKYFIYVFY